MRIFITTLMSFGLLFNLSAQFGIHAGYIATGTYNLEYGVNPDIQTGSGLQAGIGYNVKLGPIGLSTELNYVSKKFNQVSYTPLNDEGTGYAASPEYTYENNEIEEYTHDHITLPILLKLYLGPVNLQAGAQAGYFLGGMYKEDGVSTNYSDEAYYNSIDFDGDGVEKRYWDFEDLDLAVVFGIGLDLRIGLYASIRGTASITPVLNMDIINDANAVTNNTFDQDFKNKMDRLYTSEITIGYRF